VLRGIARGIRRTASFDAVLATLPGVVGSSAIIVALTTRKPFAVQIVGDPREATAKGVNPHPLRPVARVLSGRLQALACRRAVVARYVTNAHLQSLYPPGPQTHALAYSTAQVTDVSVPRHLRSDGGPFRIISVASLQQSYKGIHHLIAATDMLLNEGLDVELVIVGDGDLRSRYEELGRSVLGPRSHFVGALPGGQAVRDALAEADVFALASQSEGLPRAVIEAMSMGLPCVATNAGGTRELLPDTCVVPIGDVRALANALALILTSSEEYGRLSNIGIERVRQYSPAKQEQRRIQFLALLEGLFASRTDTVASGGNQVGHPQGTDQCA
jgi:glycosyltransferase involved in cell wall biosynthesis